jgi:hypothetical protein
MYACMWGYPCQTQSHQQKRQIWDRLYSEGEEEEDLPSPARAQPPLRLDVRARARSQPLVRQWHTALSTLNVHQTAGPSSLNDGLLMIAFDRLVALSWNAVRNGSEG